MVTFLKHKEHMYLKGLKEREKGREEERKEGRRGERNTFHPTTVHNSWGTRQLKPGAAFSSSRWVAGSKELDHKFCLPG